MATDEGSAEMKRLLEEESERLTDDARQFGVAVRSMPDQPYGVPPQSGFDALGDMRESNRELRGSIDAVETSDATKGEILDALDAIDRGFGAFERALETGVSRKGKLRMKSARNLLKRGAQDLQQAKDKLG